MKIWKYSGTLLTITGVIHTAIAFLFSWETYKEILSDGLINSIGRDSERALALWFLVCGVLLIFLGQTLQYYINRDHQPAPLFLGYSMLIFSVVGSLIYPLSGFWLFIPQSLIIILAKRNN